MSMPPPGWYPNPDNLATTRWWDGQRWADYVVPQAGAQPLALPGAAPGALPGAAIAPQSPGAPGSEVVYPGYPTPATTSAAQPYASPQYAMPAYATHPAYTGARRANGYATAALILGICGFVLMGIPLFIGLVLGGIPDVLAVVFGIVGLTRSSQLGGAGRASAIWGLVLGGVSLLSVFIGAGWLW